MLTMSLAIEGEEGYHPEIYKTWVRLMTDYLTVAIAPSGANHEDDSGYYGFRGGLPAMMCIARHGDNLFHYSHFRRLFEWQLHATPTSKPAPVAWCAGLSPKRRSMREV